MATSNIISLEIKSKAIWWIILVTTPFVLVILALVLLLDHHFCNCFDGDKPTPTLRDDMYLGVAGVGVWWRLAKHFSLSAFVLVQCTMKRVQTCTMTIYTEAKINRKMTRNSLKTHLPRANNT